MGSPAPKTAVSQPVAVVTKPVASKVAEPPKVGGQGIEVLAGAYGSQAGVPVAIDPVAKAENRHPATAASASATGPAGLSGVKPAAQGIEILAGSYDSRPAAAHPRRVEKPASAAPLSDTTWADRLRDRLRESGQ